MRSLGRVHEAGDLVVPAGQMAASQVRHLAWWTEREGRGADAARCDRAAPERRSMQRVVDIPSQSLGQNNTSNFY